jgi:hypothetical protein
MSLALVRISRCQVEVVFKGFSLRSELLRKIIPVPCLSELRHAISLTASNTGAIQKTLK